MWGNLPTAQWRRFYYFHQGGDVFNSLGWFVLMIVWSVMKLGGRMVNGAIKWMCGSG